MACIYISYQDNALSIIPKISQYLVVLLLSIKQHHLSSACWLSTSVGCLPSVSGDLGIGGRSRRRYRLVPHPRLGFHYAGPDLCPASPQPTQHFSNDIINEASEQSVFHHRDRVVGTDTTHHSPEDPTRPHANAKMYPQAEAEKLQICRA